jgi:predicted small lipoprotein YifL
MQKLLILLLTISFLSSCSKKSGGSLKLPDSRNNNDDSNSNQVITIIGALDTTYDSDGIVSHDSAAGGSAIDTAYGSIIDSNDNLIVVGVSWNATSDKDVAVWRYLPSGTLDTSFGGGDGIYIGHGI